jgi:serine/threonine protein kinase HipA of HipAB toxin-antitoxin module
MCFNVRSGNADDHGKNHGFLFDPISGQWMLSPADDLTPSHSRDREMRGLSAAEFIEIPMRNYISEVR